MTRAPIFAAIALCLALLSPTGASAQVFKIMVPTHNEWCVSSQPVDIATGTDPKFGDLVFMALYNRLELKALEAKLDSFGVPFLSTISDAQPPMPAPAANAPVPAAANAGPPAFRILRVCANIPAGAPAAPNGVELHVQQARNVYATRCDVSQVSECQDAIVTNMKSDGINVPTKENMTWTDRQAMSASNTATDVTHDLTDSSLRTLHTGSAPNTPDQLITISAEIPQ